GLRHVTGMAISADRASVFVGQLEGNLSVLDIQTGAISATFHLTNVGLSGVAVGGDRVFVINAPGRQLIGLDPLTMMAESISLPMDPAALAVDPRSATVYVLDSDAATVARVNPSDGSDLGEISLGASQAVSLEPSELWRRPRIA